MVAEVRTVHKNDKDLDLSTMTNSKEILPQYRDQLEAEIKDIFLVCGQLTKRCHGNDENGQRKKTKLTTVTQTVLILPVTFHSRTKCPPQYSCIFRIETRRRRQSSGNGYWQSKEIANLKQ